MNYSNIITFAPQQNKKNIITATEKLSVEEVPMIAFSKVEGNQKFANWIRKTLVK